MPPNNYIIIQDNFLDGKLIRQMNGMYAVLRGDNLSESHSSVRRLLAAEDKETSNGKQDTVQESTGDTEATEGTNTASDTPAPATPTVKQLVRPTAPKKSGKKASKK